jgi:hypothetical protein
MELKMAQRRNGAMAQWRKTGKMGVTDYLHNSEI